MSLIQELRDKATQLRTDAAAKAAQLAQDAQDAGHRAVADAEAEAAKLEGQATTVEQRAQTHGGIWATIMQHSLADVRELFQELESHL